MKKAGKSQLAEKYHFIATVDDLLENIKGDGTGIKVWMKWDDGEDLLR